MAQNVAKIKNEVLNMSLSLSEIEDLIEVESNGKKRNSVLKFLRVQVRKRQRGNKKKDRHKPTVERKKDRHKKPSVDRHKTSVDRHTPTVERKKDRHEPTVERKQDRHKKPSEDRHK